MDDDHPRLLIPFRSEKGEIFAYQGRAFGKEQPKYLTIKLEERDKIFGLDRVNKRESLRMLDKLSKEYDDSIKGDALSLIIKNIKIAK